MRGPISTWKKQPWERHCGPSRPEGEERRRDTSVPETPGKPLRPSERASSCASTARQLQPCAPLPIPASQHSTHCHHVHNGCHRPTGNPALAKSLPLQRAPPAPAANAFFLRWHLLVEPQGQLLRDREAPASGVARPRLQARVSWLYTWHAGSRAYFPAASPLCVPVSRT